ncbi:PhoH family protein [Candidatus Nitrosacidococcus tergens]|uniref:PhoH family protein n=1 Tax=Candidatus Nitrosacidococcus tergens TaxID=553981 RepID=A0A7G1Q8D9_9GAMM|nr:PhoH family protein [Candidatus Nitrosacidococcus tergens]CAB1275004.1 PhoH family protein [Candidatus Nitrosacidococcus tergens]
MNNHIQQKQIFIIDTSILLYDPSAIFRFGNHDIYLPLIVIKDLESTAQELSEAGRNAKQSIYFLNKLLTTLDSSKKMMQGFDLSTIDQNWYIKDNMPKGRLFFQSLVKGIFLPSTILEYASDLKKTHPNDKIVIVSKSTVLRAYAIYLNFAAKDYHNNKDLDDANLLHTGYLELPYDLWRSWQKSLYTDPNTKRSAYQVTGIFTKDWYPNQCLHIQGEKNIGAIVRNKIEDTTAVVELIQNYQDPNRSVWGISARNQQQNFALNLLLDPEIDFVTLLGPAGTGKTLLALAAGLTQTLETKHYQEIIMTRITVPVGEDIGFLPGTEEEKMTPWMGALMDNLEVLAQPEEGGSWGRSVTHSVLLNRIKIHSLNFMRGRTFHNKFIIIDEAQNLTPKQMKTLITRTGNGSKVICLGNISQIDSPDLTPATSGLTYTVKFFKSWRHSGHVTLTRGERSRLAGFASNML